MWENIFVNFSVSKEYYERNSKKSTNTIETLHQASGWNCFVLKL